MQWSLGAVVLIVNALFGASCASTENGKGQISSVFEAFGYSPACVASALTSCEYSSTKELSVDVVDSIEVTKSFLQELKSERENSASVVKTLLQEMKSERENSASVIQTLLQEMKSEVQAVRQEMKSEIKAIRQEMKSAEENSSSVVNFLLQEMKSEIKAIRQEMKSTEDNSSSVVNFLLQEMKSEIKAIRQEMKSTEDNSSSVVNFLLQEMKSEIKAIRQEMKSTEDNSSSVVKSLLQEIKSEGKNTSSEVKSLLQEMKSEIKAIRQEMKSTEDNSSSVVKSLLQEMKSEIKAIRQEMKFTEENSSSIVKSLLQEMKSEIKVTLYEVKLELENVPVNSQSRACAIPGGTTATLEGKELPKNCAELKEQGETSSGVQTVYPYGSLNPKQTTVYCDQVTDGGGWTVIQSRSPLPIRDNFYRNWTEYVEGFGHLKGEFWLGLDNIHALTNSSKMELRIDLEDAEGKEAFALYTTFHVGDAASKYVLSIGGYSGDAGDGMTYPSYEKYNANGMMFTTWDNDNDLRSGVNCAELYGMVHGWWFNEYSAAPLNGLPLVGETPFADGIIWEPFRGFEYSMKKASMKIRPVSLGS